MARKGMQRLRGFKCGEQEKIGADGGQDQKRQSLCGDRHSNHAERENSSATGIDDTVAEEIETRPAEKEDRAKRPPL